jgi:hypothetical protein
MGTCANGQCPLAALQLQPQGGGYLRYKRGKGRGSRRWALSSGCATQLQELLRDQKARQTSTPNLLLTLETSETTTKQNHTEADK